jgi:predicted nucleic-acid-binding protein
MIGIDTNVLVRFFVRDDQRQNELAERFMRRRTADDPVFVSAVVMAEFVWVLEQVYDYSPAQIRALLTLLLTSVNVAIEREDLLRTAIAHAGEANADVADCIIAALATDAGCQRVMTFDRTAAKRIPEMELLS